MKTALTLLSLIVINSNTLHATPIFNPERCAHDSLNQWDEKNPNAPTAGTARGRNIWYKMCFPTEYKVVFPGNNEFDPRSHGVRRVYPTFGKILSTPAADGSLLFDPSGYVAPTIAPVTMDAPTCKLPQAIEFVGLCSAGCVTPESRIETNSGTVEIKDILPRSNTLALVPEFSNQSSPKLAPYEVESTIKDKIYAQQEVLEILTQSGGKINVSLNHPLLNQDYMMVKAEDLIVGNSLISSSGIKDLIISISKRNTLENFTILRSNQMLLIKVFIS